MKLVQRSLLRILEAKPTYICCWSIYNVRTLLQHDSRYAHGACYRSASVCKFNFTSHSKEHRFYFGKTLFIGLYAQV
jgi:hypothetical protein